MARIPHGPPTPVSAVNPAPEPAVNLAAGPELALPLATEPEARLSLPTAPPRPRAQPRGAAFPAFDYLFPALQRSRTALLPKAAATVDGLQRLGRAMSEPGDAPPTDSTIPAIYTYFGQFLDHEISWTREATDGSLPPLNPRDLAPLPDVPKKIVNGRSPRLDLDCIYGPMPDGRPVPRQGDLLTLGRVSAAGERPPGKDDFNDLPRQSRSTVPEQDRAALIGDPRNDENLIVAQLHVAFLRAHNALIEQQHTFEEARRLLRQHFQWLVIHDFLPRIADPALVRAALERGRCRFDELAGGALFMPLEFSVAAYRFGHSLVRGAYRYNRIFARATLPQLFTLTAFSGDLNPVPGEGAPTLPENWIIEWEDFLDGGQNAARRLDTHLTEPLTELRGVTGAPLPDEAILAVRNLWRSYQLRIPTGQAVARALGVRPLPAAEIEEAVGEAQARVLRETGLSTKTPLWYYILAEAAREPSDHLGPVGSLLVVEVLIELVRRSEDSILRQADWRPTLGATPGQFALRDLLQLAGVLTPASVADVPGGDSPSESQGEQSMLIIQRVRGKKARMKADPEDARANRELAIAAMFGGIGSEPWRKYMEQFIDEDNEEQLRRLIVPGTAPGLTPTDMDIKRAYMVSNAICGSTTVDGFDQFVHTIDDGLASDCGPETDPNDPSAQPANLQS